MKEGTTVVPPVKNPSIINPLPEMSVENVEKYIINTRFADEGDENRSVFGAVALQTIDGEDVCGCFVGLAASNFGLEDPTLSQLKAAARQFKKVVSQNRQEVAA